MKKIYRTMLLFSSTVIFLAVAPLIVLYALGYRLNSADTDPLPVSVLQVESLPSRADIAINGQAHNQTPQTISTNMPGAVTLTVKKEGYETWEKKVVVEPGRATEFRAIRLFRYAPPTIQIAENITDLTLSPNRKLLAAIDQQNNLHFFDEDGIALAAAIKLSATPQRILWSPDSTALLLTYARASKQVVLVATRPQLKTIHSVSGLIKDIMWDPRIPGRLFILTQNAELWAYNHVSNTAERLLGSVTTMATTSRSIIAGQRDGSILFLTLQGQLISRTKPNITSPIDLISATPAGNVVLRTRDTKVYYLASNEQLVSVSDHSEALAWSPDGTILMLQTTPNEIMVWNTDAESARWLPTQTLQLVQRLSRPLRDPQWFAGSRHVIYQVDDEIHITEIDTRDHAIDYRLDTTNLGVAHTTVGRDGQIIYYLKKQVNKTSLLRADIAE